MRAVLLALALPGCGGAGPPGGKSAIPPQSAVGSPASPIATSPNASSPDDVRARLDEWLRLVGDDHAIPAADDAAFLAVSPHWPDRGLIQARVAHALAERSDDAQLATLCPDAVLTYAPALLACARVLGAQAMGARARTAWVDGIDRPQDEGVFIAIFGRFLTDTDQWRRFERELHAGAITAAGRQIARLSDARQPLARALLAYRARSDDADRLFSLLAPSDQGDPQLTLYRLQALRHAGDLDGALALWRGTGLPEQQAHPARDWTRERAAFARALMLAGRTQDAAPLADDQTLPAQDPDRLEADFLTGWLALRTAHDPDRAATAFQPLTASASLLTRSRGWYWLGRARAAAADASGARAAYARAAAMPTTFYGQLALASPDGTPATTLDTPARLLRPALARLPAPRVLPVTQLSRRDLAMAARMLAQSGDLRHARDFLMMAQAETHDVADLATIAALSRDLGLDEPAVYAARAAGHDGVALYPAGWPDDLAIDPNAAATLPQGLVSAVVRQESSFNPAIASPAGAIGLLQLLPASAADVARIGHLGDVPTSAQALRDPEVNLLLGETFLSQLAARYNGVVPYMLAAYNAGPHRADSWILPDAGLDPETMIDWIERIPYEETRSYIERIEENAAIYRAEAPDVHAGDAHAGDAHAG